jgi:hypothetical protein
MTNIALLSSSFTTSERSRTSRLQASVSASNIAPLHGERDIEWQFDVIIPYRGWTLDADLSQLLGRSLRNRRMGQLDEH